nr:TPA_asm: ATP8 [Bombus nevadensis]
MPQMMPINWLIIFILCLLCLFMIMINMNSLLLYFNFKNKFLKNYKKWKWNW